jgi:hypothetical protein
MGNTILRPALSHWANDTPRENVQAALEELQQLLVSDTTLVVASREQLKGTSWRADAQQKLATLFEDDEVRNCSLFRPATEIRHLYSSPQGNINVFEMACTLTACARYSTYGERIAGN